MKRNGTIITLIDRCTTIRMRYGCAFYLKPGMAVVRGRNKLLVITSVCSNGSARIYKGTRGGRITYVNINTAEELGKTLNIDVGFIWDMLVPIMADGFEDWSCEENENWYYDDETEQIIMCPPQYRV